MLQSISVDTIQVVARLTTEQIYAMFENVKFRTATKHYQYVTWNNRDTGEPFYGLYFMPKNPYVGRYYNTMVYLQNEAVKHVPSPVRNVLRLCDDWRIKRLDIAFDFDTPIRASIPLLKGNTTLTRYGQNYYVYGKNSKCKALCYDKASQLTGRGIETLGDWTRFEVRMKPPTLDDAVLYHWDFEWVERYMSKFTWIPDISDLNIAKTQKDVLTKTIKRRVDFNWKNINTKTKKALQKAIAEQRTEFDSIFHEQVSSLFRWFWDIYHEHPYYTIVV